MILPAPRCGFLSAAPAAKWEHALLCGNGVHGAMVYGEPCDETIIINRAGLFMPLETPLPPPDTGAHLAEIRSLLARGEDQPAADFVVQQARAEGWYEKRWTDPFIPAFDLRLQMVAEPVLEYARSVDFSTGLATVAWTTESGFFERKTFVSRADNVVVVSLRGPRPGSVSGQLHLATRPTTGQGGWRPEWFFRECIREVQPGAEGEWLTWRGEFRRPWPGSLTGYAGAARVIPRGGTMQTANGTITIHGADEILVLLRVELLRGAGESILPEIQGALLEIEPDFSQLHSAHTAIHGALYDRVQLDLGSGSEASRTSEELLAAAQNGQPSAALIEKVFAAGRYAILSSTGELPPVLPGIWCGTWGAPWSGDFTQNGNLQTAIAANLATNLAECLDPYFRLLETQLPASRENARRLYGCRGIHLASRVSSHGLNNHFDATWPMTFWTAGAGWAAHFFHDYYLYTGDRDFLKNRAWPFMREAAEFYEDFLLPGEDGKLLFSPSYSPENHPANDPSQACINASMDVAVARELFTNLLAVSQELDLPKDQLSRWQTILEQLPDYQINAEGAVQEWCTPRLADHYEHRHASHLYALFYGLPEHVAAQPALRQAFARAIELRMDYRRREPTGEMAFGLVQLAQASASLRDAATCGECFNLLASHYWSPSLTSTHDIGRIFNVDICGGLPEILCRMLVDSAPGWIVLLPALPVDFPHGRIEGLRCRGQIELRQLAWSAQRVEVVLESAIEQEISLTCGGQNSTRLHLSAGVAQTAVFERESP